MQRGLISVVMSTYNEQLDWIKKSVESILNQTNNHFEFIVVLDNPENERLKELLYSYQSHDQRIKLIINEKNLGLVNSLNIALKHCTGEFIARMDADDISIRNRLEIQKKYLEENKLDFVFSGVEVIDEEGSGLYETNNHELDSDQTKRALEGINISFHPTWFLKSAILKDLQGYRDISYCEDYDFLLRCLNKEYKLGKMAKPVLQYRVRESGISKSYSLEQYLNAKSIFKLYKTKQLENGKLVVEALNKSKRIANDQAKNKYNQADSFFFNGTKLIKNGKMIQGTRHLIRSTLTSKYFLLRNKDILIYKIANRKTKNTQ